MLRWYAVHCQPNAESKAEANLRHQGFRVYLPRYRKTRRHARRVDSVRAPLFPRYLFVELDAEGGRWRSVQSTFGVHHLVCQGDRPVPLPNEVIDHLLGREDGDGLVSVDERPRLSKGETVRFVAGAMTDLVGIFDGLNGEERVTILLNLLGRRIKIVAPADTVAAAH